MIVSVTNNKGGCGKTTTAVNLAAALRLRGFDVLAVDLDGQANLSVSLRVEAPAGSSTFDALKQAAAPYIVPVRVWSQEPGAGVLDVFPASEDLAALDVDLSQHPARRGPVDGFRPVRGGRNNNNGSTSVFGRSGPVTPQGNNTNDKQGAARGTETPRFVHSVRQAQGIAPPDG